MEMKDATKVICPRCGKVFPVRILELTGKIKYSVRCPECKRITEVVLDEGEI